MGQRSDCGIIYYCSRCDLVRTVYIGVVSEVLKFARTLVVRYADVNLTFELQHIYVIQMSS